MYSKEEKIHIALQDEKHKDILVNFEEILGIPLRSFKDLELISEEIILKHIDRLIKIINTSNNSIGSIYAWNHLLYEHNYSYDDLILMFSKLTPGNAKPSFQRMETSNFLVKQLDQKHANNFIEHIKDTKLIDRAILMYGLPKIINLRNRNSIVDIIRKSLKCSANIDSGVNQAKKMSLVELKPDFEKIEVKIENTEVKKNIKRLLNSKTFTS